jgi:hypothetical protein
MIGPSGFVSRASATNWDAGIVVGGGDTGAVLFGDAHEHRVVVSTTRFFLPVNSRLEAPALAGSLPELQRLLLAEDDVSAAATLQESLAAAGDDGEVIWTDPLVPCATLTLRWDDEPDPVAYRREIDFESGRGGASWSVGRARRTIDLIAERGTGRVLVRVRSGSAARLVVGIGLGDGTTSYADGIPARGYGGRVRSEIRVTPDALVLTLATVRPTTEPSQITTAVTADRAGEVVDGELVLDFGEGAEAVFEIAVGVPPSATAPRDFDSALGRQRRGAHGELMRRSALRIGSGLARGRAEASTEELWERARAGDPEAERGVIELAFAAGRSTIISSTGILPPTLQGVWQGTWAPAWSADYTLNGNVQNGALAALAATGTPELLTPLFELIGRYGDDYEANARRLFGVDGWLLPSRMTTHGRTNHFAPEYPHEFWWGSGAWAVRMAWEYITTTGDVDFARRTALPLARQVTRFYRNALVEIDGVAHAVPSYSPENTPAGRATPLAVDATSEIMMIADAFRLEARLAAIVGEPPMEPAPTLPALRIADGLLAEWIGPGQPERPGHRHASQLYDLWYEDPPWIDDEQLRAAALAVVQAKLEWRLADPRPTPGHMEMAFGLVQLGLAAARLGAAEAAHRCALLLARDHWGTNGVSLHDAGAIFNVDASGGLPALVAAMLVGSHPGTVMLLPALPDAWPDGRVEGLRLRGGLLLDSLAWSADGAEAVLTASPSTRAARDGDVTRVRTGPGWEVDSPSARTSDATIDLSTGSRAVRLRRVGPVAP